MKHLGDITKISGYDVPPVDVVIGGSPCQDLSVAGKRAGLAGERSGLFMEQIRIIKEMREADVRRGCTGKFIRPRFMVWENVPGAFSSHKGEDFRIVLEEIIRIAEPNAPDVPLPAKGKWPLADCWMGDGWSVAYRVLDAQFWGVPQRRRRIALVADFGGQAAPEILFVRKGVCGDIAPGGASGKEAAAGAGSGAGKTIYCLATQQGGAELRTDDKAPTLTAAAGMSGNNQPVICAGFKPHMGAKARGIGYKEEKAPTMDTGSPNAVYDARENGEREDSATYPITDGIVRRLTPLECERLQGYPSIRKLDVSKMTKDEYIAWNLSVGNIIADTSAGKVFATRGPGGVKLAKPKELTGTNLNGYKVVSIRNGTTKLSCRVHRIIWIAAHGVLPDGYCIDHINNNKQDNRLENLQILRPEENSTKAARDGLYHTGEDNKATKLSPELWDEIAYLYDCTDMTMKELAEIYGVSKSRIQQIIKEIGWTDIGPWTDSAGKLHKESSDSARYKALGNSIALPPWKWVLKRLCACYERDATMASLFDGIGGFPLIWERLNGPGSCLWASEIEEFPIAVTKRRFGGTMDDPD